MIFSILLVWLISFFVVASMFKNPLLSKGARKGSQKLSFNFRCAILPPSRLHYYLSRAETIRMSGNNSVDNYFGLGASNLAII